MTYARQLVFVLPVCSALFSVQGALAQGTTADNGMDWTAKLASLPCVVFTEPGYLTDQRWISPTAKPPDGSAPFGVPYLEWTTQLLNALQNRVRACGNPMMNGLPAMMVIEAQNSHVVAAEKERRARDRQAAANVQTTAEMERIAALPSNQQVPLLQQLAAHTNDRQMSQRIQIQIARTQDLAAEQAEADRRTAAAAAAEQQLANTQRAIEQGQRDAAVRHDEIERERAALAEQARRTEAARHDAEAATGQVAQFQQQQAALAPAKTEIDQQRERDEAELRRLREQRASLEQQGQAAREQAAQSREQVEAKSLLQKNSEKLVTMGFAPALLDAMLMFDNGNGNYSAFVTLRQFLSVLLAAPDMSLTSVTGYNGTRPGFTVKRPGAPSSTILFRPDANELYLDSFGQGDTVSRLSDHEAMSVALTLVTLYHNALKGALSAAQ